MGEKQTIKPNCSIFSSIVSGSEGFKGGIEFVEDRRPLVLSDEQSLTEEIHTIVSRRVSGILFFSVLLQY